MTDLASIRHRARFRAVTWASTRPGVYYGLRRLTRHTDRLCIRPDTDIVIEGYPRSANSTTVYQFLAMQDRPRHVAHHKHHAAQLLRAAEWGIPAVVLIRAPREASLSLLALAAEARHRAGKPEWGGLSFSDALTAYVAFYEAVEPTLDHTVIGRFDVVRGDVPDLIAKVNERFGTSFRTEGTDKSPKCGLGWHAMPNEIRKQIKGDLERRFERELRRSASLRRLLTRANTVHARYEERDERAG